MLESRVLTALLTPNSLQSSYVLFELGARWGTGRRYFPLFAAGITPRDVNDWLRGITGTRCSSETDLMSLISDVANTIGHPATAPPAYLHLIKQVIEKSEKAAKAYTHEYGSFDPEAQALQQAQMKAADAALGHSITDFWGIANRYFTQVYQGKGAADFPDRLEELIHVAEAPPNTADGNDIIYWPTKNERRLNQDQRRLWAFAKQIYPARPANITGEVWKHSAIKPVEDAKRFHDVRRELAKHFDLWPPLVGQRFIYERFGSRFAIICCWRG